MKQLSEKLRIILADDDLDDCEMFRLALEKIHSGFVLDLFHDGKKLIEYLQHSISELPHIVFMDLNMPFLNGLEALREMRKYEKLRKLTVVIYSTSSNVHDMQETLASGANAYIVKPQSFTEIQEVLKNILEKNIQS